MLRPVLFGGCSLLYITEAEGTLVISHKSQNKESARAFLEGVIQRKKFAVGWRFATADVFLFWISVFV